MTLDEITYKINGCAMRVHSILGNGYQELIYQKSLAHEFEKHGLVYKREVVKVVYYDGIEVGTRRTDFIVEDDIMVETKAVIDLEPVHLAQAKSYLSAYDMLVGLLINFGSRSLQFNRIYRSK